MAVAVNVFFLLLKLPLVHGQKPVVQGMFTIRISPHLLNDYYSGDQPK